MKSCVGCAYADWDKTASGRLHPSGEGKCTWKFEQPKLPASMYIPNGYVVRGGYINRRKELKEHCVFFKHKEK